jgi:hypothetical protein
MKHPFAKDSNRAKFIQDLFNYDVGNVLPLHVVNTYLEYFKSENSLTDSEIEQYKQGLTESRLADCLYEMLDNLHATLLQFSDQQRLEIIDREVNAILKILNIFYYGFYPFEKNNNTDAEFWNYLKGLLTNSIIWQYDEKVIKNYFKMKLVYCFCAEGKFNDHIVKLILTPGAAEIGDSLLGRETIDIKNPIWQEIIADAKKTYLTMTKPAPLFSTNFKLSATLMASVPPLLLGFPVITVVTGVLGAAWTVYGHYSPGNYELKLTHQYRFLKTFFNEHGKENQGFFKLDNENKFQKYVEKMSSKQLNEFSGFIRTASRTMLRIHRMKGRLVEKTYKLNNETKTVYARRDIIENYKNTLADESTSSYQFFLAQGMTGEEIKKRKKEEVLRRVQEAREGKQEASHLIVKKTILYNCGPFSSIDGDILQLGET